MTRKQWLSVSEGFFWLGLLWNVVMSAMRFAQENFHGGVFNMALALLCFTGIAIVSQRRKEIDDG